MKTISPAHQIPRSLVHQIADLAELQSARASYIKKQNGVHTREVVENVKKIDDSLRLNADRIADLSRRTGHNVLSDPDTRNAAFELAHAEVKHRHEERRRTAASRKHMKEMREDAEDAIEA